MSRTRLHGMVTACTITLLAMLIVGTSTANATVPRTFKGTSYICPYKPVGATKWQRPWAYQWTTSYRYATFSVYSSTKYTTTPHSADWMWIKKPGTSLQYAIPRYYLLDAGASTVAGSLSNSSICQLRWISMRMQAI